MSVAASGFFLSDYCSRQTELHGLELALGAALLLTAAIFVFADFVLGPFGAMAMAAATLAIYWVAH